VPLCGVAARTVQTAQPSASNVDGITGCTVQSHYGNPSEHRFGLCVVQRAIYCLWHNEVAACCSLIRTQLHENYAVYIVLSAVHFTKVMCLGERLLVNHVTILYVKSYL
jgi:hypothetical protein